MKELIKKLTSVSSPSGREEEIRNTILEELKGSIDGYEIDKLGNLIVWKKGKKEGKILLDAHMDEVGVLATYIDERGFIRIEAIGGVSPYNLLGSSISFPKVEGIVGIEGETPEELTKNIRNLDFDKIYVDIGAKSREEAEKLVPPGTFGVYHYSFKDLGERIVSKSLDDRIGCTIIIEVLKRANPYYDLFGTFSTQEEIGLVGASVVAFNIKPDLAIAIDVTSNSDTPKGSKRMSLELGKGPTIKIKDRASISDRKVVETLKKFADKNNIPYQVEILLYGGTDAAMLQRTGEGIIAGTLSIPTRYVHSPNEMVDMNDVENAIKLLKALVESEEPLS
ncbi:MAG TPA: M42 family metallopeptidase [Dictyoglomaceae bacterium]|nr:M42 family metallopeptidase [Dictyoglomaceae bacterium]HOL39070.1 M42 family metallopeptidase [Dictyoglomaceae bacterium]HOP94409.1 M42 family metallopeptidase [Dictyoglomaceae bacterium]HPP15754.1 M42 family metallopeptidase [Dictyoglomaceae bacterium]HPU42742.1 M42 family metallopeptidase [Dictyoglomaceae bacterium]